MKPGRTIEYGLTGALAEDEVFGKVAEAKEFQEFRQQAEYITYREALDLARAAQPGEPTDPAPRFANDLHATVAEQITPTDYQRVKFMTAVGSPLDFFHGVDAFFDIEDENGKIETVTLDVKTHPSETVKADILIVYPSAGLDPRADKQQWQELISQVADEIVNAWQTRRQRKI